MGSSKKGMLNVLIAAVLWGSSGVCAQFIMQESQMSSPFLTMTRLLFAGLILLMLGFVHGDRIFRVLQNRRYRNLSEDAAQGCQKVGQIAPYAFFLVQEPLQSQDQEADFQVDQGDIRYNLYQKEDGHPPLSRKNR